jgi:hypothetical protein
MKTALLCAVSLVAFSDLARAEEPSPLRGFPGVGEVVVASAHPDLGEARLRALVEERLQKASLLLDSSSPSASRLSIRVSGDHNTSARGAAYTSYDAALTVTEPASLERDPSSHVSAVVWQRAMRVGVFARELPAEAIIDKVQDLLGSFVAAVQAMRQAK